MKEIEVKMRFLEIEEIEFIYETKPNFLKENISSENYNVKMRQGIRVDIEKNIINVQLDIILSIKESVANTLNVNTNNYPILKYSAICKYEVQGLDFSNRNEENSSVELPNDLVKDLTLDTYTFIRGVLFSKCSGSLLQNIYIPMLGRNNIINTANFNKRQP